MENQCHRNAQNNEVTYLGEKAFFIDNVAMRSIHISLLCLGSCVV